jgi:membrane-bound lytic murein transglycosylase D
LYNLEKSIYAPKPKPVEVVDTSKLVLDSNGVVLKNPVEVKPIVNAKPTTIWHRVARGETLHSISVKYEVTIEEIKKWNYLRNNTAPLGRNLKIIKTNNPTVAVTPTIVIPEKPIESVKPTPKPIEKIKEKEVEIIETKPIVEVPAKPVVFDSVVTIFHTVARNESIEAIAERYNVTLENIKTWNGLTSSWVNIDQKLKILINVKLFQPELGGKQKPVERVKPMEKKRFYTVKPGDMFIRIAENHSLTPEELHELNPKTDPNTIRVGEILRVK